MLNLKNLKAVSNPVFAKRGRAAAESINFSDLPVGETYGLPGDLDGKAISRIRAAASSYNKGGHGFRVSVKRLESGGFTISRTTTASSK